MEQRIIGFSFLFFGLIYCFSQNASIEYLIEKNGMKQMFTLDISGKKSLFYSNEFCNPAQKEIFNYVVIETADIGNYIFHDEIEVLHVYFKQEIILKWDLAKETKTVDDTLLNKATTTYKGRKWVAWYHPNTQLNFGPFIFGNLPGLIYEIHTDDYKMSLASIDNKNKNCVKISNREKPIDKEHYDKYNKELLEILKAGYEKKTNVFDNMTMQSLFENSIKKDLLRELL